jgi:cell division ATPase FtsA
VLEQTPPELASDIYNDGIILTGGLSKLTGLARLISEATKLRVRVHKYAADCVIMGCGKAIRFIDEQEKGLIDIYSPKGFSTCESFKDKKISTLKDLQEAISMYYSCAYVTCNDKEKKILVMLFDKREDITDVPCIKHYFKHYSNVLLRKAENGSFYDLIHFVEYHTLRKIRQKNKEDIEKIYKEIEETREEEEGKELSVNNGHRELDYLGCFVPALCEIWLCESLIKETANKLADEYMQKLFPNSSLLKNDIEAAQLSMAKLLIEKVLTHEFGHLIFKWTNQQDGYIQEKQANYFSSYINDGKIDGFIADFTRRQPVEYHNPYLIGDKHADELYKSNN